MHPHLEQLNQPGSASTFLHVSTWRVFHASTASVSVSYIGVFIPPCALFNSSICFLVIMYSLILSPFSRTMGKQRSLERPTRLTHRICRSWSSVLPMHKSHLGQTVYQYTYLWISSLLPNNGNPYIGRFPHLSANVLRDHLCRRYTRSSLYFLPRYFAFLISKITPSCGWALLILSCASSLVA